MIPHPFFFEPRAFFRHTGALLCCVFFAGLAASSALGQVTFRLVGDDAQGVRHFLDIDRIETEGDVRRYWRVQDLRARNEVGAMSTRTREEMNCSDRTIRNLFTVHYQGIKASGAIVITLANKSPDFLPFTESSVDHKLYERVCLGL